MKTITIDWCIMSELGLVEKINREVLHPMGLAISYDPSTGISEAILIADDLEWEYAPETKTTIKTPEHIKSVLENLLRCGINEREENNNG